MRRIKLSRLSAKLLGTAGIMLLAMGLIVAFAMRLEYQRMREDRIATLRGILDMVRGAAEALQRQEAAGRLSHAAALAQFRQLLLKSRFGNDDYVFMYDMDGKVLIQPAAPAMEGRNMINLKDPTGRYIIREQIRAARRGGGAVQVMFPKPGQTVPVPKLNYVEPLPAWHAWLGAGEFLDDVDATFRRTAWELSGLAVAAGVLSGGLALLLITGVTRALGRLEAAMRRLAQGDLTVDVPFQQRRDEVGAMARALSVFKQTALEHQQLARAQEAERAQAAAAKQAALQGMAGRIEQETGTVLRDLGERAGAMTETAGHMSASADRTGASAEGAAEAARRVLGTAQTVAAAAEELTVSIREIAGQVTRSSAMVGRAVEAGHATRAKIEALNSQVALIGAVADMIGEIAAKTNLLALNATIEAARAGDAGKGFAVVASEVKALATQTARSTEQIAQHIGEVRAATVAAVAAVLHIGETITEIDRIAASVSAAVEQQGAATAEIARNVGETANAANEMTERTGEVSAEAIRSAGDALTVREAATALNAAMNALGRTLNQIVRTSTGEVDRRREARLKVDLACQVRAEGGGAVVGRVIDLSEHGAAIRCPSGLPAGSRLTVTLTDGDVSLPAHVRAASDDVLHVEFALSQAEADRFQVLFARLTQRRAA